MKLIDRGCLTMLVSGARCTLFSDLSPARFILPDFQLGLHVSIAYDLR